MGCSRKNFAAAKNRAAWGRRCSAWCGEGQEEWMSSDAIIAMDELGNWIWLGRQRL
uniref:Uncharacterized protein n=1 Tax=Oryza sativa subsp. japonica TaxID=39947 RepID=Q6EP68_ORYSJ|nr:hypothetical protein [Oryza sativa Japonica Group]